MQLSLHLLELYIVSSMNERLICVGVCLFGLFHAGALLTGSDVDFTISSALLFGTICAAVDPVAVS